MVCGACFLENVLGFLFRFVLWLASLVFFLSLLAAGLVILLVWLLRALWAKLLGRPVSPWTFQVNRQAAWQGFYRQQAGRGPAGFRRDDVVDDNVVDADVIDVEPKRIERRDQ